MNIKRVGNLYESQCVEGRVYCAGGIAPTLGAAHFTQTFNCLVDGGNERYKKCRFYECAVQTGPSCVSEGGVAPCLMAKRANQIPIVDENLRVRRLTPRECFRLQGWSDDYFDRARPFNSDSQLYKQAGNGVTVAVIKAIAERMAIDD